MLNYILFSIIYSIQNKQSTMTDDKKQAALEMANEELKQHTELKAGQDTTDVNSKYGDAPD